MPDTRLAGKLILVTRPTGQASELLDSIVAAGGTASHFPVIEIVARPADRIAVEVSGLPPPDLTIFVSRNAVRFGATWSAGKIAAVGPATSAALQTAGLGVDVCPDLGFDSESLLAEAALADVAGQCVRIIRGVGGRDLLAKTLAARGASVHYLQVYERRLPKPSDAVRAALLDRLHSGQVDAVVIMSVESLTNLFALLPGKPADLLGATTLVTPAARVLKEVAERFPGIARTLARGSNSADLVSAIAEALANQIGTGQ